MMHGWAELTEGSRFRANKNIFSSWPFDLLWEGFLFPYQRLHMEISEGPQHGVHIPKANRQTLREDDKYQPQLPDILEVFSRKLRQHLAKPLAFHTTLSGTDPLRTKRSYQRLKTAQLKAHLEDSEPLKAVMQLRTVYSLSTWRVLEDSFPLHKHPG